MLVLTRKVGESFRIGSNVIISVVSKCFWFNEVLTHQPTTSAPLFGTQKLVQHLG